MQRNTKKNKDTTTYQYRPKANSGSNSPNAAALASRNESLDPTPAPRGSERLLEISESAAIPRMDPESNASGFVKIQPLKKKDHNGSPQFRAQGLFKPVKQEPKAIVEQPISEKMVKVKKVEINHNPQLIDHAVVPQLHVELAEQVVVREVEMVGKKSQSPKKSNNKFQPKQFLASFSGVAATNYEDLERTILQSEYLKIICSVYQFHRTYPAEFKTLGAVPLNDMQSDKVDYMIPGKKIEEILRNFTVEFFSYEENKKIFFENMQLKDSRISKQKTPAICLSAMLINIDGQRVCFIAIASYAHHLSLMQAFDDFIKQKNASQSNIIFQMLQGNTGNYSNLTFSVVGSVRGRKCEKYSNKCVERINGSALTKLFLQYGEKANIEEGLVVDFYPYATNGNNDLFANEINITPPDFRHGTLDLNNGYSLPLKPACEECKIVKYGALTVWKFAQEIGEGKLVMSVKAPRSTSPLENNLFNSHSSPLSEKRPTPKQKKHDGPTNPGF